MNNCAANVPSSICTAPQTAIAKPHQFVWGWIAASSARRRQTTNATTGSTKNPCDMSGSVAHCRAKPASSGP